MRRIPYSLLDTRKQSILKAVVNDYISTAEPVGSHVLVSRYQFGVKSATIRNEMAELSEMGYLQQPHTSAGRIPSDMGYRFYVDRLMDGPGLAKGEAARARDRLLPRRTELDIILEQTCRILADLTRYTSMATDPVVSDTVISHVTIAAVAQRRLLAVIVLDSGRVLHELLEARAGARATDPARATSFLSRRLAGRTLKSLCSSAVDPVHEDAADMNDLLDRVLRFIRRELEPAEGTGIHLEGTSYIVQQPEFKDIERLEAVLSVLERRSALFKLFSAVYLGSEVTVIIGSENPLDEMRDCSFVGTTYRIGGRVAGTLGVVGPTRMDYRRAVSAVEFMSGNLSHLLTELSVC